MGSRIIISIFSLLILIKGSSSGVTLSRGDAEKGLEEFVQWSEQEGWQEENFDLFYGLNCDIKNETRQYHLRDYGVKVTAYVDAYRFTGEYNCSGVLYKDEISDLESDLPFNGAGNFTVMDITTRSEGLLETYKKTKLHGTWNDTKVTKYIDRIEAAFGDLYVDYLRFEYLDGRIFSQEAHLVDTVEREQPLPYSALPSESTIPTTSHTSTTLTFPKASDLFETQSAATSTFKNFGGDFWTVLVLLLLGLLTLNA